jgi:hypothetical protein
MQPSLFDTDTLSEIMKGFDQQVQDNARRYLAVFHHFTFSIITRYEILVVLHRSCYSRDAIHKRPFYSTHYEASLT